MGERDGGSGNLGTFCIEELVTVDPAVKALLQKTDRAAAADVSVLVLGESGTGKELLARRIHAKSRRASGPLVSVNCGALQETLLLSELFGHERGAFTGATAQKRGLVEEAHGGTLFLDEIGELGAEAQAKLLRFLQHGEVQKVGGNIPTHVDVRLVAATNRDLDVARQQGRFREDLFYRINTVVLRLPTLRQRPADIPLLLRRFLDRPRSCRRAPLRVGPDALERLLEYRWPGNIRELENVAERLAVLVEGDEVRVADLPEAIQEAAPIDRHPESLLLEDIERRHILRVLTMFEGNKTKAASALGVTPKTLYNKLARYARERDGDGKGIDTLRFGERSLPTGAANLLA